MRESAMPPGGNAELIAAYGPLAPYCVELLLAERVALDPEAVVAAIGDASGAIDVLPLPSGAFALVYRDHRTDFKDAPGIPMRHLVCYTEGLGDESGRIAALQQTWDWPAGDASDDESMSAGARAAIARSRAVLYVGDDAGLQSKERLALFERIVRALVVRLPVLAIHWVASQRIVDPAKYVVAHETNSLSQGPINVRFFHVANGVPGEMMMDTLGLAAFGLRDLQRRFVGLSTGAVVGWLYECARHVFERGDFMEDRDTIDGVDATWRCHHTVSTVAPERAIVELRTDPPEVTFDERASDGVACPHCNWVPTTLSRWECDCGFVWNTFDTRAKCPACEQVHRVTECLACGNASEHGRWYIR